jgi:hypothetical protein
MQTLGLNRTARDAVGDIPQSGVQVQHLRRHSLICISTLLGNNLRIGTGTYLAILAALEKGRHANEAYIVVPHHAVLSIIPRHFEAILEYFAA